MKSNLLRLSVSSYKAESYLNFENVLTCALFALALISILFIN